MQLDRRIAADHSLEHGRQKLGVQALDGDDANLAATQATQRIEFVSQALLILEHVDHMPGEQFARGGEAKTLRTAIEQRRAELALQCQQLPVDRRRGHMQPARCLADRPAAPDGVEIAQRAGVDLHGRDDGEVSVPTGPGLGVEVGRVVLAAYRA